MQLGDCIKLPRERLKTRKKPKNSVLRDNNVRDLGVRGGDEKKD